MIDWKQAVRGTRKRVLLCEPDERIIQAARILKDEDYCIPVLLGSRDAFLDAASKARTTIDDLEILAQEESYTDAYLALRSKPILREEAEAFMQHPAAYGCMLLKHGLVDGMVCGCTWPTAETIRPALHILRKGVASSYFIMKTADGIFLFADSALNIAPDANMLAQIAINTAREAERLGIPPRIAMLSFSTLGSATHPEQKKVADATLIVHDHIHHHGLHWNVAGEFQVDAAMVPEIARRKAPHSEIQGDANVFIFPDLDAGNIGYKLVQRFGHAEAIGPFMTGFTHPVNDLSRGCSVEEIVDVCSVTAWESLQQE